MNANAAAASRRDRRGGTLETGLDLIEALASIGELDSGVGVSELASMVGADKGNVHRLLGVLERRGYVQQDPITRRWSLSVAVIGLAGRVLRSLDVREAAAPVLTELVAQHGETAHLAVATPSGGLYVMQERPTGRMSVETELGAAPVLHASATGKALLAFKEIEERDHLLDGAWERHTPSTHRDRASLEDDLAEVRRRGFAVDDEELQEGVRCVAAPVRGIDGDVVATVGLSGPVTRIAKARLAGLGAAVVAAAERVGQELGGPK